MKADISNRRADAPEPIPEAAKRPWGVRHAGQLPLEQIAVLVLAGVVLVATYPLAGRGVTAGVDNLNFFYPMFSFLGEQLRSGNVPGWNPYQFSGAPFAADPESGWTYLPAMLLFAALPLEPAAPALMLFHFLLAALGMYALARVLGISILGALVAAIGFALSGFFYGQSVCCPAYIFVSAWIPLMLLGVLQACVAAAWFSRLCWLGAAGLALSQVLAMWLGQGSYYAVLLLGSFTLYRTVVAPVDVTTPITRRLLWCATQVATVLAWAAGFAAAGILPRVEYVNASNLAGGYSGASSTQGTTSLGEVLTSLVRPAYIHYAGISILVLALASLWLTRGRFPTPYLAAVGVMALILAADLDSPLHTLFYLLLPRFEDLHRHASIRILLLLYPAAALLAGAAVGSVRKRPIIAMILLAVVVVDLLALGPFRSTIVGRPLDLAAYYDDTGAAAFLQSERSSGPSRYFGYAPWGAVDWHGEEMRYIWQLFQPEVTALLVNNRATLLRLEDIQGYNPLHLQRYGEYIDRLNGKPQEYHGRYVLPSGIDSPLLDLLNARFMVIPAEVAQNRPDLESLVEQFPVVYRDDLVMVLENREALPRAWIVHEARQVAPGEALGLLTSGAVDPRRTALLESEPPALAPVPEPSTDLVAVQHHAPDEIRVLARTAAPGLLLLSEIYYPAWQAYVDGNPAPVYQANHALRAVPLPAGEHTVELRYESAALRAGLVISLISCAAFGVMVVAMAAKRLRARPGNERGPASAPGMSDPVGPRG